VNVKKGKKKKMEILSVFSAFYSERKRNGSPIQKESLHRRNIYGHPRRHAKRVARKGGKRQSYHSVRKGQKKKEKARLNIAAAMSAFFTEGNQKGWDDRGGRKKSNNS